MTEHASSKLLAKRIARALKRSERYAAWKHDPNRKPTAKELARRYRREVLKKV